MLELIGIVIESLCLTADIPKHWAAEDRRLIRNIILGGTLIGVVLIGLKLWMST